MNETVLIKEMPEDERPREKMLKKGVESLSNVELLAVLLRTGTREMSAIDLSKLIIGKTGTEGLKYLAKISTKELRQIKGVGITKAGIILAAIELGKRVSMSIGAEKILFNRPDTIAEAFMEDMRHRTKEVFKILLLDTKNRLINDVKISEGSLNASIVHPREVFLEAIKRSSNKIILLHNHPSGNPEPSNEDIKITKRLCEAGMIVGIEVLDHLIIGNGTYYSFKENMLI